MSMQTTFIVKPHEDLKEVKIKIITEQYETGLYVATYCGDNPIPDQGMHRKKELPYHKSLRKIVEKQKDTLIVEESTLIK